MQGKVVPVETSDDPPRISSGSAALDDILDGGFDRERVYLYEGRPGTGKTTLALQFLLDGVRKGETVLYVSLSENERELRLVARRHGWTLDGIDVFEIVPPEITLDPTREMTVFHPAEIELSETIKLIFEHVERLKPTRIVFDSLSEVRLLAQNALRYRRQILALKHFFSGQSCTVVLLDDLSGQADDLQLHSITHGVILLEQLALEYGAERRRLRVMKMRGIDFRGGFHDFTIERGGLQIYPRLIAAEHHRAFAHDLTSSGNAGLDELLGGGLERGTNTLLIGAAGVGKSSLSLTYVAAAAARGERSVVFAFDEGRGTIDARAAAIGLDLQAGLDSGLIQIQQIDPAEMSPGEFTHRVRNSVDDGARMIVIDSLNGYMNAMPDERFLVLQMHELLSYLSQQGVLTILILAQHGLIAPNQTTPVDLSYLSDAVIMLRYFEFQGTVRRALSVVKKRSGRHENTIREFRLTPAGITVGSPLNSFSGIFSGTPTYSGGPQLIMSDNAAD